MAGPAPGAERGARPRGGQAPHPAQLALEVGRAEGVGGGVLLAHDLLAYDDLRTGRLIIPVALPIATGRAYYVVCPRHRSTVPQVRAFRDWIKHEVAALDWAPIRGKATPAGAGKSPRARR